MTTPPNHALPRTRGERGGCNHRVRAPGRWVWVVGRFKRMAGRSGNKSSRLRELQLKIAPPERNVNDLVSDVMRSFENGTNEKERALEEFLDLCESDEAVREAMRMEHLSRADLMQLYANLSAAGLGQWVEGHYAALSTIAYVEVQ
jgi:hypothetical protein